MENKMEFELEFEHLLPWQIEEKSFAIIEEELKEQGICLKPEEAFIIKRAIHTTADFDYASNLVFSPEAIAVGMEAIRKGSVIITDTNMAKSGINKKKLIKAGGGQVFCFMADEDVAARAKETGCTRAAASMEKAARMFGGSHWTLEDNPCGSGNRTPVIMAVGNAPTALSALYQMIQEGRFLPTLIIGVPVGFVNVVVAKEQILRQNQVPYIVSRGRKGGSNVAAAIVNALIYQNIGKI